jgi:hypothetical protein
MRSYFYLEYVPSELTEILLGLMCLPLLDVNRRLESYFETFKSAFVRNIQISVCSKHSNQRLFETFKSAFVRLVSCGLFYCDATGSSVLGTSALAACSWELRCACVFFLS